MTSRVETRVGPIAYSDTGDGPLIVLLHATLHDRHDFDGITPALCRDYRVLALDWPGHGESPALTTPFAPSAALFADILTDVVDALDLPPAVFLGNSVGGFAAARLAITHPNRVAGLVLVDAGGFSSSPVTNLYCRVLGTPAVMRPALPRFVHSYLKAVSVHDHAIRERVLARAHTRAGVELVAALWRSFATPDFDLRNRARKITAPTLIVWGTRDTAIPLRFGRAARDAIAGSRLETLPTGHLPFSSDPAGFLAITEPFLATVHRAGTPR